MTIKFQSSALIKLLLVAQCVSVLCVAQDFDFFYFVQQWPGSYCDTKKSCCYPKTGKPDSDFGIHGLWPNYKDGNYPSNCDPNNPFDESKISDLVSRMQEDWPTLACPSGDGTEFWLLEQHSYFQTTLDLKKNTNLLQALQDAGITPDGNSYSLESIKDAIKSAINYTPWIECNNDADGNSQLYQVYLCVDSSASGLIECPVFPHGKCASSIEFPSF
nr:extracellular ribonuclease LE-like [Ipomoea batatas]